MIKNLNISRLFFWLGLSVFITACGVTQQHWAGITRTEENTLLVSNGNVIIKLDANTGEPLKTELNGEQIDWGYPAESDRSRSLNFYADVISADNMMYVGDYTGGVHAINAEGKSEWAYLVSGTKLFGFINFGGSTDRVIGSISVGEDVLYVPHEKGVFLLNRKTGKPVKDWELVTERAVWSQPAYVPAEDESPPLLYVTSLDHYLYAVDASNGNVLWKTDLEGSIPGSPVLDKDNGVIFAGTFASEVLAVDSKTGKILDRYQTDGWVWGEVVIHNNTLYFADLDGYVYAATFEDGKFQKTWSKQVAVSKIRTSPLVTEDLLVIGTSSGIVYGIKRESGEQVWETSLESPVLSTIVLAEAKDGDETLPIVVVVTNDKDRLIVGLRLDNGNQYWAYPKPKEGE